MFTFLEKIGIVCIVFVGIKIVRSIVLIVYHFAAPLLRLNIDLKSCGSWAVVTGGTDGLGRAFAQQLAAKGLNIVVVSRTKDKLDSVARELEDTYGVQTKVIEADFTQGQTVFGHIEKELFGLEIGVLVNNIGISYPHPQYFLDLDKKEKIYHDIIQCNIESMLGMCQIAMPGMAERRRGVVINISSTAADIPSPLLSVYGASKIFVSKFSKDLASEYRKSGITVQCLVPGYVATKMSKIKQPTWMAPSPTVYVRKALSTVGVETHTTGYYPHTLLLRCIELMEALSPAFAEWMIIRTMENIRSRALKKVPSTITS
ncbi:hypothetical protein GE061_000275 [Apolygus lucorum]|uniref:Uncharacterized protein n=1 Tax=Apolygus lucorum TaxID=248454 RepID=A0A6A4KBZ9_APOLU|nr:hypothetical protein GE061_000275 [Apolygus lucorum]